MASLSMSLLVVRLSDSGKVSMAIYSSIIVESGFAMCCSSVLKLFGSMWCVGNLVGE